MDELEELQNANRSKPRVRWRMLLLAVLLGGAGIAVSFLAGWWWVATVFLLGTGLVMCLALPAPMHPLLLTVYSVFALWWVVGSALDEFLPRRWPTSTLRAVIPYAAGGAVGVVLPLVFWLVLLYVSTKWILGVSDSFGVPFRKAFRYVAAQVFGASQAYQIVENGAVTADNPKGMLSKLGGPGMLVVRPGNAVVLERGGTVTRIEGQGVYPLKRFEFLKNPQSVKGIVDLGVQPASETVSDVTTKDGIPLEITVRMEYQIEPKAVTDKRPSSHFERGDASARVLEGEYPVYESTIRKAVFSTTADGWQKLFPEGPISVLRDIVASYTLDQIFAPNPAVEDEPDPDARTVRRIEERVVERFDPTWAGVQLKVFDIQRIVAPPDVKERILRRWMAPVDQRLRIAEANADREALILRSIGRASALGNVEAVKAKARQKMVETVAQLLDALSATGDADIAVSFVSVLQELTRRVGDDDTVTMNYIEAMRAIVQSDGPKSFVITPPNPSPGMLPGAPAPSGGQVGSGKEKK